MRYMLFLVFTALSIGVTCSLSTVFAAGDDEDKRQDGTEVVSEQSAIPLEENQEQTDSEQIKKGELDSLENTLKHSNKLFDCPFELLTTKWDDFDQAYPNKKTLKSGVRGMDEVDTYDDSGTQLAFWNGNLMGIIMPKQLPLSVSDIKARFGEPHLEWTHPCGEKGKTTLRYEINDPNNPTDNRCKKRLEVTINNNTGQVCRLVLEYVNCINPAHWYRPDRSALVPAGCNIL